MTDIYPRCKKCSDRKTNDLCDPCFSCYMGFKDGYSPITKPKKPLVYEPATGKLMR